MYNKDYDHVATAKKTTSPVDINTVAVSRHNDCVSDPVDITTTHEVHDKSWW